jgi:hypothetical protein
MDAFIMEKKEKPDFEKPLKSARDKEKDRDRILSSVSSFSSENMNSRVALLLNNYPWTRDSDFELQKKYWETFQPELLNGETVHFDNYHKLASLTSIARARAFIQNTCGLFEASLLVRAQRGMLEEEEKAKIKQEKPDYPAITVYADESGKNEKILIVGSVWVLNATTSNELMRDIFAWRRDTNIKSEFHISL